MNDKKIDILQSGEEVMTEFSDKWHKTYDIIENSLPKNVTNQEIECLFMFIFDCYQITDPKDITERARNAAECWIYMLEERPEEGEQIH
tara:strand:- start:174 stop:440 length:267 start_codon:yes stop_codon:yes gene_type:complete